MELSWCCDVRQETSRDRKLRVCRNCTGPTESRYDYTGLCLNDAELVYTAQDLSESECCTRDGSVSVVAGLGKKDMLGSERSLTLSLLLVCYRRSSLKINFQLLYCLKKHI